MPSLLYRDPRLPLTVLWVPRSEWGSTAATESFIANRYSATAAEKTNVQIHHTAAIDIDDATPNQWDYDEAAAYMRRLQTSRPDLGPLPYSENLAVAEDPERVWLFEGRGLLKVGAHTAGYNRSGIGWGVLANFDKTTAPEVLSAVRQTIRLRVLDLKSRFPNLGTLPNPRGWDVWGHRDTAAKSCPGNLLYPTLSQLSLQPEDDMAILTDAEQIELQKFLAELAGIGSNVGFVRFVIPWFRRLSGLNPEALAELEESAEIDALEAKLDALVPGLGVPLDQLRITRA